jgi:hypothetical protein
MIASSVLQNSAGDIELASSGVLALSGQKLMAR